MARKKDGMPRPSVNLGQAMTRSGFCEFPSFDSHRFCKKPNCTCECHGEAS